jgi:UDP-2,3-diacylglucosamine hydrolase
MTDRSKIYFASDTHLGSDVFENSRQVEKRFVCWLDSIKHDARAVYLVGDIFDFWYEYKYVVPRGFTRFLGKISEMSDMGIEIHLFIGNHDIWFFDYLPEETGAIIHREPLITEIDGKKFFITHGDGLGDNSRTFRLIRNVFHNRICQVLFSSIHPRWSFAFAHAWSKRNRKKSLEVPVGYMGEDKEHLILFAKDYNKKDDSIDFFIFGHRHIMLDLMLSHKNRMIILGDWLQYYSYAVFGGEDLILMQFECEG